LDILVLLSGGIDSTACVEYYISRGYSVSALHINYGQPNCIQEQTAAASIADHYRIPLQQISIKDVSFAEGYIAARNAVLLCLALMLSRGKWNLIALGIHADTPYSDCSPEFVRLMQDVFNIYEHGRTRVTAPFLTWTKSEIFDYARTQGVPLHLTYSSNPDYFQREAV
jgi:7-cyano-7-deazaguanine synthase